MTITYFGNNVNSDGSVNGTPAYDLNSSIVFWNSGLTITCPGSGLFDIVDLSHWCKNSSGQVRLAIYNQAGTTLIAYGTSLANTLATADWYGHQSAGAITQLAQLTGGVNYTLVATTGAAGGGIQFGQITTSSGQFVFNGTNHYETGSFPSSLPAATNTTDGLIIRCGVTAVPVLTSDTGASPIFRVKRPAWR